MLKHKTPKFALNSTRANIIWAAVSQAVEKLAGYLVIAVLTRILLKTDLGALFFALSISEISATILNFGTDSLLIRLVSTEPGPEYEALCTRIIDGLSTFVDADGGEPLIQNIARLEAVLKELSGVTLDCYPDLTIDWVHTPARRHRAIYSPKYGTIPWPTPHRNPEGRSGNHRMEGFIVAAGRDIKSGTIRDARMIDLAPTILTLLGQRVPEEMDGRPLDILA